MIDWLNSELHEVSPDPLGFQRESQSSTNYPFTFTHLFTHLTIATCGSLRNWLSCGSLLGATVIPSVGFRLPQTQSGGVQLGFPTSTPQTHITPRKPLFAKNSLRGNVIPYLRTCILCFTELQGICTEIQ